MSLSQDKSDVERAKVLLVKAKLAGYTYANFQGALVRIINGKHDRWFIGTLEDEFEKRSGPYPRP